MIYWNMLTSLTFNFKDQVKIKFIMFAFLQNLWRAISKFKNNKWQENKNCTLYIKK